MKPPEYLGPYRIGETLGKGGMGAVFKAEHAKSGQEVAVKLIATQVSDEMRFRRRFHSEVETLKLLSHKNIVKLIGYGEEQGMLFYSMEYVAGDTLQEIIRQEKKLPWMTAIDIAIQVCAALKHAHDFGVIHRDLKPANLIVQADGSVKLLDFGISKLFGNDQTAVGSIMGTADYMAPEQANESGVTVRTDLFALGCLIYAMLVGKPPFRGKSITAVLTALKHDDPIPLDLIDPDLPEDLVQIVMELLEKKPEDRPPTALAVMNRLKAMRAGLHHMQTLADRRDPNSDDQSAQDTTRRRAKRSEERKAEPASGDTTAPPAGRPTDSPRSIPPHSGATPDGSSSAKPSDKTKSEDTLPYLDDNDSLVTAPINVDASARTVYNDSRGGNESTVLGTGVTAPVNHASIDPIPDKPPPDSKTPSTDSSEHSTDSSEHDPVSDTSIGSTGKTHFQTVSDGDVRQSSHSKHETKTEHPAVRVVSIAVLIIMLLIGGVFVIQSFRGPTADELLVAIEEKSNGGQAFEVQNEIERFLKLFPEHPKADDLREQQMVYRVEAAIRLLKLKSNLRPSEGPLYEQAFLDAMDLRADDPVAARKKLQQWIIVFKDSTMDDEDEQLKLAELAKFEADRLSEVIREGQAVPGDPKLAELMKRIEDARQLPAEERMRLLEGIVTLYEGQAWADQARRRALELLGQANGQAETRTNEND